MEVIIDVCLDGQESFYKQINRVTCGQWMISLGILYASLRSDYSAVDWAIPVKITQGLKTSHVMLPTQLLFNYWYIVWQQNLFFRFDFKPNLSSFLSDKNTFSVKRSYLQFPAMAFYYW